MQHVIAIIAAVIAALVSVSAATVDFDGSVAGHRATTALISA